MVSAEQRDLWAITGASGFIGRALIERLRADGIAWRGLSRTNNPDMICGDVRDAASLRKLVDGATVVVHLAAYVHKPARRKKDRRECWAVNVHGTENVIEAMAEVCPDAFLIFISSANVYGASEDLVSESHPLKPSTAYGESKVAAEERVRGAIKAGRLRGVILRPSMVFAPGAPGNFGRLIKLVKRGFWIRLGRGDNRKSLLPLQTMIDSILAIAGKRQEVNGETFNVAGSALPMRSIVEVIAGALGVRKLRTIALPKWPLIFVARIVDALLRWTTLPSLAQMVETYASAAALSDEKLRSSVRLSPSADVRSALAGAVRLS